MKRGNTVKKVLLMLLLIIVLVPLGMYVSLDSMQDDVISSFYSDKDGIAISQEIRTRTDAAENILKIVNKYKEQYPELSTASKELEEAVQNLEGGSIDDHSDAHARANAALDMPAQILHDTMADMEVEAQDQTYLDNELLEMKSSRSIIDKSGYNEEAVSFNQKLEKYPAKLMKDIGIFKALPDYRSS